MTECQAVEIAVTIHSGDSVARGMRRQRDARDGRAVPSYHHPSHRRRAFVPPKTDNNLAEARAEALPSKVDQLAGDHKTADHLCGMGAIAIGEASEQKPGKATREKTPHIALKIGVNA